MLRSATSDRMLILKYTIEGGDWTQDTGRWRVCTYREGLSFGCKLWVLNTISFFYDPSHHLKSHCFTVQKGKHSNGSFILHWKNGQMDRIIWQISWATHTINGRDLSISHVQTKRPQMTITHPEINASHLYHHIDVAMPCVWDDGPFQILTIETNIELGWDVKLITTCHWTRPKDKTHRFNSNFQSLGIPHCVKMISLIFISSVASPYPSHLS